LAEDNATLPELAELQQKQSEGASVLAMVAGFWAAAGLLLYAAKRNRPSGIRAALLQAEA